MIDTAQAAHLLTTVLLGLLLLIGALAAVGYLAGASAEDLLPSRRTIRHALSQERGVPEKLTIRHVLGFGLLVSGPLLVAAAVLFVTVQRPPHGIRWLAGAVVLAVGSAWLSHVVGPPVAAAKPALKPAPRALTFRELAGMLIAAVAITGAVANVGGLLVTGAPLFPPHPLNPLFPLGLIVLSSAGLRLMRGRR
jgi:hypothetical protein